MSGVLFVGFGDENNSRASFSSGQSFVDPFQPLTELLRAARLGEAAEDVGSALASTVQKLEHQPDLVDFVPSGLAWDEFCEEITSVALPATQQDEAAAQGAITLIEALMVGRHGLSRGFLDVSAEHVIRMLTFAARRVASLSTSDAHAVADAHAVDAPETPLARAVNVCCALAAALPPVAHSVPGDMLAPAAAAVVALLGSPAGLRLLALSDVGFTWFRRWLETPPLAPATREAIAASDVVAELDSRADESMEEWVVASLYYSTKDHLDADVALSVLQRTARWVNHAFDATPTNDARPPAERVAREAVATRALRDAWRSLAVAEPEAAALVLAPLVALSGDEQAAIVKVRVFADAARSWTRAAMGSSASAQENLQSALTPPLAAAMAKLRTLVMTHDDATAAMAALLATTAALVGLRMHTNFGAERGVLLGGLDVGELAAASESVRSVEKEPYEAWDWAVALAGSPEGAAVVASSEIVLSGCAHRAAARLKRGAHRAAALCAGRLASSGRRGAAALLDAGLLECLLSPLDSGGDSEGSSDAHPATELLAVLLPCPDFLTDAFARPRLRALFTRAAHSAMKQPFDPTSKHSEHVCAVALLTGLAAAVHARTLHSAQLSEVLLGAQEQGPALQRSSSQTFSLLSFLQRAADEPGSTGTPVRALLGAVSRESYAGALQRARSSALGPSEAPVESTGAVSAADMKTGSRADSDARVDEAALQRMWAVLEREDAAPLTREEAAEACGGVETSQEGWRDLVLCARGAGAAELEARARTACPRACAAAEMHGLTALQIHLMLVSSGYAGALPPHDAAVLGGVCRVLSASDAARVLVDVTVTLLTDASERITLAAAQADATEVLSALPGGFGAMQQQSHSTGASQTSLREIWGVSTGAGPPWIRAPALHGQDSTATGSTVG